MAAVIDELDLIEQEPSMLETLRKEVMTLIVPELTKSPDITKLLFGGTTIVPLFIQSPLIYIS